MSLKIFDTIKPAGPFAAAKASDIICSDGESVQLKLEDLPEGQLTLTTNGLNALTFDLKTNLTYDISSVKSVRVNNVSKSPNASGEIDLGTVPTTSVISDMIDEAIEPLKDGTAEDPDRNYMRWSLPGYLVGFKGYDGRNLYTGYSKDLQISINVPVVASGADPATVSGRNISFFGGFTSYAQEKFGALRAGDTITVSFEYKTANLSSRNFAIYGSWIFLRDTLKYVTLGYNKFYPTTTWRKVSVTYTHGADAPDKDLRADTELGIGTNTWESKSSTATAQILYFRNPKVEWGDRASAYELPPYEGYSVGTSYFDTPSLCPNGLKLRNHAFAQFDRNDLNHFSPDLGSVATHFGLKASLNTGTAAYFTNRNFIMKSGEGLSIVTSPGEGTSDVYNGTSGNVSYVDMYNGGMFTIDTAAFSPNLPSNVNTEFKYIFSVKAYNWDSSATDLITFRVDFRYKNGYDSTSGRSVSKLDTYYECLRDHEWVWLSYVLNGVPEEIYIQHSAGDNIGVKEWKLEVRPSSNSSNTPSAWSAAPEDNGIQAGAYFAKVIRDNTTLEYLESTSPGEATFYVPLPSSFSKLIVRGAGDSDYYTTIREWNCVTSGSGKAWKPAIEDLAAQTDYLTEVFHKADNGALLAKTVEILSGKGVVAGISSDSSYPAFWAGSGAGVSPSAAPFTVTQDGCASMVNPSVRSNYSSTESLFMNKGLLRATSSSSKVMTYKPVDFGAISSHIGTQTATTQSITGNTASVVNKSSLGYYPQSGNSTTLTGTVTETFKASSTTEFTALRAGSMTISVAALSTTFQVTNLAGSVTRWLSSPTYNTVGQALTGSTLLGNPTTTVTVTRKDTGATVSPSSGTTYPISAGVTYSIKLDYSRTASASVTPASKPPSSYTTMGWSGILQVSYNIDTSYRCNISVTYNAVSSVIESSILPEGLVLGGTSTNYIAMAANPAQSNRMFELCNASLKLRFTNTGLRYSIGSGPFYKVNPLIYVGSIKWSGSSYSVASNYNPYNLAPTVTLLSTGKLKFTHNKSSKYGAGAYMSILRDHLWTAPRRASTLAGEYADYIEVFIFNTDGTTFANHITSGEGVYIFMFDLSSISA